MAVTAQPPQTGQSRPEDLFGEEEVRGQPILIVDDSQITHIILRKALEAEGFSRVQAESDPWQVVEKVVELEPAVLLLDADMPELDGFGALQLLAKELGPLQRPVVLMMVEEITDEVAARALGGGAEDLLARPIKPGPLTLKTRSAVYRRLLERRVAAGNAVLQEQLVARTRELDQLHDEMIDRLGLAADYRDDSSGEHGRRVGQLAFEIATALKLSPGVCDMIRRAAPLHDLGKIAIPDEILLKPAALDEAEKVVMRQHTTIGAKLLSGQHPLLWLAGQIAMTHHEHFDGSGYPDGLVGDDIPLPGRIVAVADAFDVLTSARPYRPPWPRHRAIAEILTQSGRQFDPRVVDAFLSTSAAH